MRSDQAELGLAEPVKKGRSLATPLPYQTELLDWIFPRIFWKVCDRFRPFLELRKESFILQSNVCFLAELPEKFFSIELDCPNVSELEASGIIHPWAVDVHETIVDRDIMNVFQELHVSEGFDASELLLRITKHSYQVLSCAYQH